MDASTGRTDDVCLVVTGGDPIAASALHGLPPRSCTIGVDSGVGHALALGLHVDLAVGDFDSLDRDVLAEAERTGTTVERHPAAKDATDLELGLDAAVDRGATRVSSSAATAAGSTTSSPTRWRSPRPATPGVVVEARMGRRPGVGGRPDAPCRVAGAPGDDRLPAPGRGVRPPGSPRPGLAYELRDGELGPGTTRGVSNEMTGASAAVRLTGGTLLVVVPGTGPS
jgi:thiamine pyrophosphokinase